MKRRKFIGASGALAAGAASLIQAPFVMGWAAIGLEKLKTEYGKKVEILGLPLAVLRDLKKLSTDVMKAESDKTPMAKKVYASFTKFQGQLGGWRRVSEFAYHQFVTV